MFKQRKKIISFIKRFNYQLFKNAKGQVAVFVALLFQVLFLFFAIVINVGLLVHHKINLQNSVDLAAYYGAMKQAEMLNAMAHINYQIRQSYKLMTWRYRVLGTAGESDTNISSGAHPYDNFRNTFRGNPDETPVNPNSPKYSYLYERPYFCIAYKAFDEIQGNDNVCMKSYLPSGQSSIRLPAVPPVIAGFIGLSSALRNSTQSLLNSSKKTCENRGALNYITLGRFVYSYWIDQKVRKKVLSLMSRALSEGEHDFYDIDGKFVKEGIKKTLEKNLTEANRASFKDANFEVYNGLGDQQCGNSGISGSSSAKWLGEQKTMPMFYFVDYKPNSCNPDPKNINIRPSNSPTPFVLNYVPPAFQSTVKILDAALGWPEDSPDDSYVLGYEKDPWCMAYVGVKASTSPKIPFSPLGTIKLEARAFAKPFGGRFGPWNNVIWPHNIVASARNRSNIVFDPLLSKVINNRAEGVKTTFDDEFYPNYSRFPGDVNGLKSNAYLGEFAKYLWTKKAKLSDWENNIAVEKNDPRGDILAMPGSEMRKMETMAIAPDIFDITYYSIEPDFYNMYFERIRKGLAQQMGIPADEIRSDIGSNLRDQNLASFSVKDQVALVKSLSVATGVFDNFQQRFTPYVLDFGNLLTGWKSKDLHDYSLDTDDDGNGAFGKCQVPVSQGEPTTSGSCVIGGRTGYSVKLISKDYLKQQNLELGGPDQVGEIRNPPPDNF